MADNRISGYSDRHGADWPPEIVTDERFASAPQSRPQTTADLYAAAWSQSQRDYEFDRLFNAAFYYEI